MHKMMMIDFIDLNLNLFFLIYYSKINLLKPKVKKNFLKEQKCTINKITHLRSLSRCIYSIFLIKLLGQIKLFCKITRDKI